MFCRKCGAENPFGAARCAACGAELDNPYRTESSILKDPSNVGYVGEKPKTWLVEAILVTLFCCVPFGIAAIVFAAQVDGKWNHGDHAGAHESSRRARLWVLLSVGGWVLIMVLYFGFVFLATLADRPGAFD
jgi:hypothetical protein